MNVPITTTGITNNQSVFNPIIKLLILLVFTICFILLYTKNPYKIIDNYNSIVLLISLGIAFYVFYLNINKDIYETDNYTQINFDIFKYSFILLCYIILIFIFYLYNSTGYILKAIYLPLLILILSGLIFIICYLFLYIYAKNTINVDMSNINTIINNKKSVNNILKYFLFFSFGLTISILIIQWIITLVANTSSKYDTVKIIINILIIIALLAIVFKMITYGDFYKENPAVQLIINVIFYIPCIFVSLVDNTIKITGMDTMKTESDKDSTLLNPSKTDWILLIISILLFVVYYSYHRIVPENSTHGGQQLLLDPISLTSERVLGTYQSLNGTDQGHDYRYAISFWVYLDSMPPNTNGNYSKYTSLLNYGNKPNFLFSGIENSFMVTMDNTDLAGKVNSLIINKDFVYDERGNIIIYKKAGVLLQKWNNIIINIVGSTIDLFINGELEKSVDGIIPVGSLDTLISGEISGIKGGISNILYFKNALNIKQITELSKQLPYPTFSAV